MLPFSCFGSAPGSVGKAVGEIARRMRFALAGFSMGVRQREESGEYWAYIL